MTHQQFCTLAKDIKARYAKEKGTYLTGRDTKYAHVKLYAVDSFYVELYHDKRLACISLINSFEDTTGLQPYLASIDVSFVQEFLW